MSLLATERDGERRRTLLNSIADLFYAPEADILGQTERQSFADLVSRLLRDIDVAGRTAFSARVAKDTRTPRDVALLLAGDTIDVARPILVSSPNLSDGDLINIATTLSTEYRLAISQRPNISESISDTLIGFGEIDVAESLADNHTAAISETGFAQLQDMAWSRSSLRHALGRREDLPLVTAKEILPYLEPDSAEKLLKLMQVENAAELQALIDKATPAFLAERAARSRRRIAVRATMKRVAIRDLQLDRAVTQFIREEHPLDLALALSLASGLPERQVANAIVSVRMEPLALICKALGVATTVYIAADAMRTTSVSLPKVPADTLERTYERLTSEAARRSLRFVQLRNNVAGEAEPAPALAEEGDNGTPVP